MDYYGQAMDDAALVRASCEGDKQAFAGIYDRYADGVFGFLCTVVRNRDDAADLLQDTFITAGARLHQLRDPSKLRPWLFAIARHLAMKSLSSSGKSGAFDPLDGVDIPDSGVGPSEAASQNELAALLSQAAAGLGTQDRVVLDLHLRQGLEGQELGDALGVSASHAYVLLTRMRYQVERALGALLVARQGSKDCRKLAALLESWDGKFSPLWRKRVARHADGCALCGDLRRRAVSPSSLLGVLPLVPAPASARTGVLEKVQLVSYSGDAWSGGQGGFPPPMSGRYRRRGVMAVAAAVLLVGLAAIPTVALVGSGPIAIDEAAPGTTPSWPPLDFPAVPVMPAQSTGTPVAAGAEGSAVDQVAGNEAPPGPPVNPTSAQAISAPSQSRTAPVDYGPESSVPSLETPPDQSPPVTTTTTLPPDRTRRGLTPTTSVPDLPRREFTPTTSPDRSGPSPRTPQSAPRR